MSDYRRALGKIEGRRKAGKPKLRWLACIEDDLISVGIKGRRKKASDTSMGYYSVGGTG
jgi:hypothetical protein